MNYTSTLLNPGCNRGKWRYCSGFPTSLEDVMSSWWFFEVFASFRFWVVRYPSYQPSLTEPQSLTWKPQNAETWKRRNIWPKPPVFLGFQPLVLGCVYVRSQGRFFHPSTSWQPGSAHFLRRRYHSSSHAWRRKSRTICFSFLRLEDPLGKCLKLDPFSFFFWY